MKIVLDSTCLISLAKIGKLFLIKELFGTVYVAESVWRETTVTGKEGVDEIKSAKWIKMLPVQNHSTVEFLEIILDKGEAESIALAKEIKADLVVIDEKKGVEIAQRMKLNAIRTIAILMIAKKTGLIEDLKSILDVLRSRGFWLNDNEYQRILKEAGELK